MGTTVILPGQLRLILAITVVHIIAWYAYLGQVPLGLYPTPEERTIIDTAIGLSEGRTVEGASLTLYEIALSLPARLTGSDQALVHSVRFFNALALVLTTAACAHAAGIYWRRNRAVWIAGLLTGLNPVLVFWSAEVSPTLPAVLCTSLAFTLLLRWLRHPSPGRSLIIGLLVSAGLTLETNLIFFTLLWPIVAYLYPHRRRAAQLAAAFAFPALVLLLFTVSTIKLQSTPELDLENLGQGIYETFNNHEAYDGKSYGLHRRLNFFLFLNPLHWGLIFILALAGAYVRLKRGHHGNSIAALLICLGIFAISCALNDTGSKTRALLYPVLAIYTGGIAMLPQIWAQAGKRTKRRMVLSLLLVAGLTYTDLYDKGSEGNWETDYSFLAESNLSMGRNQNAMEWAEKTIGLNPGRDDMRSVIVYASLNEWALSPMPTAITSETARLLLEAARAADSGDPNTRAIEALYLYKIRQQEQAYPIWHEVSKHSALAMICLYWTGQVEKPDSRTLGSYSGGAYYELLVKATEINRNALAYREGEQIIDNILALAH